MTPEQRIRELEFSLENEKKLTTSMQKDFQSLEERFDSYVTQQQELEAKKLRTALIWAGGVILTLGSFIFMNVIWPVIQAGKN